MQVVNFSGSYKDIYGLGEVTAQRKTLAEDPAKSEFAKSEAVIKSFIGAVVPAAVKEALAGIQRGITYPLDGQSLTRGDLRDLSREGKSIPQIQFGQTTNEIFNVVGFSALGADGNTDPTATKKLTLDLDLSDSGLDQYTGSERLTLVMDFDEAQDLRNPYEITTKTNHSTGLLLGSYGDYGHAETAYASAAYKTGSLAPVDAIYRRAAEGQEPNDGEAFIVGQESYLDTRGDVVGRDYHTGLFLARGLIEERKSFEPTNMSALH